ncbi:sorting and assembly machinery component 50 [Anaeramoeba flamelloides]|uniref:Sorting and assembly machinery component 50 n=1 Tax=Anaeramoeba flamelloides TaxID=1746091 RepID=A0ABQ8XN86_9EUKA|nr:sorting and assembly machinery component 50 [Anaeramoeba flamelloides]
MKNILQLNDTHIKISRSDEQPTFNKESFLKRKIKIDKIALPTILFTDVNFVNEKLRHISQQNTTHGMISQSQNIIEFFNTLNIFENITIESDVPSPIKLCQPTKVSVVIKEPKKKYESKVELLTISPNFHYRNNNLFGKGERLRFDGDFDLSSQSFSTTFVKPLIATDSLKISGFDLSLIAEHDMIQDDIHYLLNKFSINWNSQLLKDYYTHSLNNLNPKRPLHTVSYQFSNRNFIGDEKNNNIKFQNFTPKQFKSSLSYTYDFSNIKNLEIVSKGYSVKSKTEFSGIIAGTRSLKTENYLALQIPLSDRVVFKLEGGFDCVVPLTSDKLDFLEYYTYNKPETIIEIITNIKKNIIEALEQLNENENKRINKKNEPTNNEPPKHFEGNFSAKFKALLNYKHPIKSKKGSYLSATVFAKTNLIGNVSLNKNISQDIKKIISQKNSSTGLSLGYETKGRNFGLTFGYDLENFNAKNLQKPNIYFDLDVN